MNKEFKRMMELAGLNEIKINKPGRYTLMGPDYHEEAANPLRVGDRDNIAIIKGNKEQILDYVVNNIAPTIGYEIQNNRTVIDAADGEEMFSNLGEFREYIWGELTGHGFGFTGEEFTVKEK
jgi:hypothetical protein